MTSCGSSVSVQRSGKSEDHRSKSCETVCTSNSSCFLQRRKPMNPLMYPVRPAYAKSTANSVRQRVMSAKLLKVRSLQSQLNDANYHLAELAKENQILKNLQKRQDKALTKYEGMNEDLPRLLHSHEEQLRTLTEKNKLLRKNVRELTESLKSREDELLKIQEKLIHLEKLNKDKHLIDREKLMDQLEDTKIKLQKADDQVAFLNRKLMLETKTSKQRVNAEMVKHKQCQRELNKALAEIDKLTSLLETKENVVYPQKNKFSKQSVSMVTLANFLPSRIRSSEKLPTTEDNNKNKIGPKNPVTEVKLEPIKCKLEEPPKKNNGILNNNPTENVKNRLSSASSKNKEITECSSSNAKEQIPMNDIPMENRKHKMYRSSSRDKESVKSCSSNEKDHCSGSEASLDICDITNEVNDGSNSTQNLDNTFLNEGDVQDYGSNVKLDELTKNLDAAIQRATENSNDDFATLGEECSNVMSHMKNCNERIDAQMESLKMSRDDTAVLMETFKKTQKIEASLKNSFLNVEDTNIEFLSEIFSEEIKFQMTNKPTDKNGNVKEPKVNLEEKKKLLATLKAIDNGDSVDSMNNSPAHRQTNLMKEIFGDVSK